MRVEKYLIPKTIEDAILYLHQNSGHSKVMAGGTDLMIWLREGKFVADTLVDITEIESLRTIKFTDDGLMIGAGVTHAEIAANGDIKKFFRSLADGCRYVGSPQIRNIATVGGNIVSAQPAADSAIPLIALEAKCEILTKDGLKIMKLDELYVGVGESKVDHSKEILTKIIVSRPKTKYGTSMTRFAPREALSLPMVNVAVKIEVEDNIIKNAIIVIAPVATTPFKPREAVKFLVGKDVKTDKLFGEAAKLASKESNPRDSALRGSSKYRKVLVEDLVNSALVNATENLL